MNSLAVLDERLMPCYRTQATMAVSIHSSAFELTQVETLMRTLAVEDSTDWLGRIASEPLSHGGKRIRARFALAAARALAAEIEAVPWAAACELLHNASLIHDDIQDGDALRRQKKSVWAEHGLAQAINAGDLLLMLPMAAVDRLACSDSMKWQLTRALIRRTQAAARGQSLELRIRQNMDSTWQDWSRAYEGKTGELLALPIEGAALLGGLTPEAAQALGDVFRRFGLVYQMWNDIRQAWISAKQRSPKNLSSLGVLLMTHLQLEPEDASLAAVALASTDGCPEAGSKLLDRVCRGDAVDALLQRGDNILASIRRDRILETHAGLQELAEELATLSSWREEVPMPSADCVR